MRAADVPMPVGRRLLHEELKKDPNDYYGTGKSISVVGVYRKETDPQDLRVVEYGSGAVRSCDLGDTGSPTKATIGIFQYGADNKYSNLKYVTGVI